MDELPQKLQGKLKKKDYILSEIFESPKADKAAGASRVICEVFRTLYALTIIHLKDNPEALSQHIKLLEEGFIMGVKMVNRMTIENASFVFGSISDKQVKKEAAYRIKAKAATNQLSQNERFMDLYRKA